MSSTTRYPSLDVLRGLTIAFMIVVNSPGSNGSYPQLEHAPWHGFTLTDLVFPTFLFAVGNAMSFTMKKYNKANEQLFLTKVFKRTIIIYLLGIFLNVYPFFTVVDGRYTPISPTDIRLVHVLGRIAICYCVVSLLIYYFRPVAAYVFSGVILVAYWGILFYFGDQPDPYSLTGNAVAKFDVLILGTQHIWDGEGIPFDPEGLLSTLPAIANVTAGYFVGQYIQRSTVSASMIIRLSVSGVIITLIGLGWGEVFPINKKLWTSSFVLLTIGLDLLILSMLLFAMDMARVKRGVKFFEVFGRNPLALYILSQLLMNGLYRFPMKDTNVKDWLYQSAFAPLADPTNASLLFALAVMVLIWIVGYFMDKNRLYIKV